MKVVRPLLLEFSHSFLVGKSDGFSVYRQTPPARLVFDRTVVFLELRKSLSPRILLFAVVLKP